LALVEGHGLTTDACTGEPLVAVERDERATGLEELQRLAQCPVRFRRPIGRPEDARVHGLSSFRRHRPSGRALRPPPSPAALPAVSADARSGTARIRSRACADTLGSWQW